MNYINPYELLRITSDRLSDIDDTTIKRGTKLLLADIELSDSNTFSYNGYELNKSDCLRCIDELDDIDKKEFHFTIKQNDKLRNFLKIGDVDFFINFEMSNIYTNSKFIDFISPYFANKYDKLLYDNYVNGQIEKLKVVLRLTPMVSETYYDKCFISLHNHLRSIDKDILTLFMKNSEDPNLFKSNNYNAVVNSIIDKIDLDIINILPPYFQGIRNQLAMTIKDIARKFNNEPIALYEPAYNLIQVSYSLNTDGLTKQYIQEGYDRIKDNYYNSLKLDENRRQKEAETNRIIKAANEQKRLDEINKQKESKLKEQKINFGAELVRWGKVVDKLDSIIEDIKPGKGKRNNFRGLPNLISSIICTPELNLLPEIFDDLRIKILHQLERLSFIIWSDYHHIEPAIKLLKNALEIPIDSDAKTNLSMQYHNLSKIKKDYDLYGIPIKKAPSLSTTNGVGTKIYGDTLYFTFLYIPIFPIARYSLMHDGLGRYSFYGQFKLQVWQKTWIFIIIGGISLLILSAIINSVNISNRNESFRVMQYEFTNNYPLESEGENSLTPYLLRKTILIDMNSYNIDNFYDELPDYLRANSVDEIKSIVQVWRDSKEVGKYNDGAAALQSICRYKIIDLAKKKAIYGGTFVGSLPPDSKKGSGSASGSLAIYQLKDFLLTLPSTEP